jgi:hypothetical protein
LANFWNVHSFYASNFSPHTFVCILGAASILKFFCCTFKFLWQRYADVRGWEKRLRVFALCPSICIVLPVAFLRTPRFVEEIIGGMIMSLFRNLIFHCHSAMLKLWKNQLYNLYYSRFHYVIDNINFLIVNYKFFVEYLF